MLDMMTMGKVMLRQFPAIRDVQPADMMQEARCALLQAGLWPVEQHDAPLVRVVAERRMRRVIRHRLNRLRDPRLDYSWQESGEPREEEPDEDSDGLTGSEGAEPEILLVERRRRAVHVFWRLRWRLDDRDSRVLDEYLAFMREDEDPRRRSAAVWIARRLKVSPGLVRRALKRIAAALVCILREGGDEDLVR